MIIDFEGMDGAGKTETAKAVADILNYEYIQKPMRMVFDKSQEGITARILDSLNEVNDNEFWALLLGAAQYYQSMLIKNKDVILDRYLPSNYYQHANENNKELFDYLVKACVKPDLTIVLYVTPSERKRRLINRKDNNGDLDRFEDNDLPYERIRRFLDNYNLNYYWINTTKMNKCEVVQKVVEIIRKI